MLLSSKGGGRLVALRERERRLLVRGRRCRVTARDTQRERSGKWNGKPPSGKEPLDELVEENGRAIYEQWLPWIGAVVGSNGNGEAVNGWQGAATVGENGDGRAEAQREGSMIQADEQEHAGKEGSSGSVAQAAEEEEWEERSTMGYTGTKQWYGGEGWGKEKKPQMWETVRLTFIMIALPLAVSTLLRLTLISPLLGVAFRENPSAFELTDQQRGEVAQKVSRTKERLWYESLVGRAPVLSDQEMEEKLRETALEFEQEERRGNSQAYENAIADAATFVIISSAVVAYRARISDLWSYFAFHFTSMRSATQAFLLLLVSDVAVGYHSADGWVTACRLLLSHYNLPENEDLISLFVAVVPVSLDVLFKACIAPFHSSCCQPRLTNLLACCELAVLGLQSASADRPLHEDHPRANRQPLTVPAPLIRPFIHANLRRMQGKKPSLPSHLLQR